MHRILWLVCVAVALADAIWAAAARFDFDGPGYLIVAGATAILGGLAIFYGSVRKDEKLSAMLSGTGFLIVFSAAFSALNYMLLTVAGPRIDNPLAAIDRALGFDWPGIMAVMAHHPLVNLLLQLAYSSVLPQIALVVLALGWTGQTAHVFRFCLSIAAGAFVTVFLWTLFPSFGAFSVYHLPPAVSSHLFLALDGKYANDLVYLLHNGPGQISPRSARGLIGFPSFHAALATMAAWYAARVKGLKWPVAILNGCVFIATPIQGGHHLVDVIGGVGVAALAIAVAGWVSRVASQMPQHRLSSPAPAREGAPG